MKLVEQQLRIFFTLKINIYFYNLIIFINKKMKYKYDLRPLGSVKLAVTDINEVSQ